MIKIAFVRGAYLNNFEGQNYVFDSKRISLTAIASKKSIHQDLPFPVIRLWSLTDFGIPKQVTNRIFGDGQVLYGLEKYAADFDIFHTADPHYYYSYQLAKLRKDKKIQCLISTCWETIPFNNETVSKKKYIKKFTMRYIDHFICYTNRAKKCLIAEGIDTKKISVIRLGVDLEKFTQKSVKKKNKRVTILFAGRHVNEKGYKDVKEITVKKKNIKFMEVNNVNYPDMPAIYNKADVLVVPSKSTQSWEEQYGMVLIEGMASGLPIVAYQSGAIPEIVGNAGVVVQEGNVSALHSALVHLATSPYARAKLGTMARRRAVRFFDSLTTSKELAHIYNKVLKSI